jgi:proline dehydrogenase
MTGFEGSNAYGRHAKVRLRHGGKWHAEHNSQIIEKPCGSWLASDGGVTSSIDGG